MIIGIPTQLPVQAVDVEDMQNVEDFVSAVSSPLECELDLSTKTLTLRTHPKPKSAASFAVLKTSTAGATVRMGRLMLRKDTVLLLSGACIHFSGTSFTGTVPVDRNHMQPLPQQNCNHLQTNLLQRQYVSL